MTAEASNRGACYGSGPSSHSRESLPVKLAAALTGQFGQMFTGVVATTILARTLGPAGKGLFTLALTVVVSGVAIIHLSVSAANSHFAGRYPETRRALVGNSIALAFLWGGLVTAACGLFLGGARSKSYPDLDQRLWGMALAAILPLLVYEFSCGLVMGLNAIRRFSLTILGRDLLFVVGLVVLVGLRSATPHTTFAVWVLVAVVGAAIMLRHSLVVLAAAPEMDIWLMGRTVKFGLQTHGANLFSTLKLKVDPILLALFLTPADVGYYSIATAMVAGLWYLPAGVAQVLVPHVSGQGDAAGNVLTPLLARLGFGSVVAAAVVLAVMGRRLIIWLPGPDYLPALPALILLLPGAALYSLAKMLSGDLMGRGRPQYAVFVSSVAFIANLIAAFFLIPRFGIIGAAAASTVTHAFTGLMFLHYFLQESGARARDVLIPQAGDFRLLRDRWNRR